MKRDLDNIRKSMADLLDNDLKYFATNLKVLYPKFNGTRLLLTGGTGFFGKWLLESLLFANQDDKFHIEIFLLSRDPETFKVQYPRLGSHPAITFLKGDVTDFELPDIKVDYIIHAATEASAKLNHEQPMAMVDSIISGTRNVLEFARHTNVKRMLYVSSGAIYGVQPEGLPGFPEDFLGGPDPLLPSSAYAGAKRTAELLCACYAKLYGIEIPVARCFAFVGPYLDLDAHFAIGNFIRNGLNGEDIIIKGDGKPMRSYMYTADLVIWLLHILAAGKSSTAYNVGSGEAVSIRELAGKVASFFPGLKVEILNQVNPTDRNQNYVPDVSKFKREFNVKGNIGLEEAISKTISYYRGEIR